MVRIITDTTSCLPGDIAQQYEIPVIPQVIIFGEDSYYEGTELDYETFILRLKSSPELPKTAAPPPELFSQWFEVYSNKNEPILCIHPSSDVSGTVRSAMVASKDFPNTDIHVIDTRTISTPLGTIVQMAAQMAQSGSQLSEIIEEINNLISRCRVYFLVATLDYLAKGGRIGGASALLGSVLQIKPILTLVDGHVDQYCRERTHTRAIQRLIEIVKEQAPNDGSAMLSIMHAGVPEEAQILAKDFSILLNQPTVPIANIPPAIATHAGPGILGVGFFVTN